MKHYGSTRLKNKLICKAVSSVCPVYVYINIYGHRCVLEAHLKLLLFYVFLYWR